MISIDEQIAKVEDDIIYRKKILEKFTCKNNKLIDQLNNKKSVLLELKNNNSNIGILTREALLQLSQNKKSITDWSMYNKYYYVNNEKIIAKYFNIIPPNWYNYGSAYIQLFNKEKINNKESKIFYDPLCKSNFEIFTIDIKRKYQHNILDDIIFTINSNLFNKLNSSNINVNVLKRIKTNMLKLSIKKLNRNKFNCIIKTTNGLPDDEIKKFHDDLYKVLIFS